MWLVATICGWSGQADLSAMLHGWYLSICTHTTNVQRCPSPEILATNQHATAIQTLHSAAFSAVRPHWAPKENCREIHSLTTRKELLLLVSLPSGPQPVLQVPSPPWRKLHWAQTGKSDASRLGSLSSVCCKCSNCHRKRKCCTMLWGRTAGGTVRSELLSLLQQYLPLWNSDTTSPCSPETECPHQVPKAKSRI